MTRQAQSQAPHAGRFLSQPGTPELVEAGQAQAVAPVYLRRRNGAAIDPLPRTCAEALLKQVTTAPLLDVTGDLARGFAWPVPGAHPRLSYAIVPLAAPLWPDTQHPTVVTVELWWPPDQNGLRLVRTFVVWATDPYDAYLIASCLWSTKATGAGAEAAFLYGPDRRVAHRINDAAWTCSQIPAATIARAVATTTERFSTDSFPDARTSAMHEERIGGTLIYTGTGEEIVACLREHADGREASMDAPGAYAMRGAAEEIERGERMEFRSKAHYRVVEASDSDKAGAAR